MLKNCVFYLCGRLRPAPPASKLQTEARGHPFHSRLCLPRPSRHRSMTVQIKPSPPSSQPREDSRLAPNCPPEGHNPAIRTYLRTPWISPPSPPTPNFTSSSLSSACHPRVVSLRPVVCELPVPPTAVPALITGLEGTARLAPDRLTPASPEWIGKCE